MNIMDYAIQENTDYSQFSPSQLIQLLKMNIETPNDIYDICSREFDYLYTEFLEKLSEIAVLKRDIEFLREDRDYWIERANYAKSQYIS